MAGLSFTVSIATGAPFVRVSQTCWLETNMEEIILQYGSRPKRYPHPQPHHDIPVKIAGLLPAPAHKEER